MKKVLLTIAAVAFAFAANAQFILGGDLGFNRSSSYLVDDGDKYASTFTPTDFGFSISPRLGYQFTEKIQAGLMLGYDYTLSVTKTSTTDPTELRSTDRDWTNMFGVGVYGRYNCFAMGKFTVFGQLNLGIGFGNNKTKTTFENGAPDVKNDVSKTFAFYGEIVPGINYALNENISFDIYLNFIALNYSMIKVSDPNIDMALVNHDWNLGANIDGISIDGLTNAITIGFNWHFACHKAE
ncbi:MAG: outer membrane beta-barrel protein [Bacteroidales bacterium]|nr:outer membrane beta-barrel protein [Bacteroidales bacterium]